MTESVSKSAPDACAPSPRRYLSAWFPFLSAERTRRSDARRDEAPLVLVGKGKGGLRVMALDAAARRLGLGVGMTLAQARAQCAGLRAAPHDEAADARVLLRLAAGCEIFTPLTALEPPDGLALDITGCAHLFGGEAGLRDRLDRRLRRAGFTARLAIAGAPDAARALARFSSRDIVAPGEEAATTALLPVAALEGPESVALALTRAGLTTLGDLAARPGRLLAARFGEELVVRLARIMGREDIRITPLRPPPALTLERHFPHPVLTVEACLHALDDLIRAAADRLEARGEGGSRFEAVLFRSDGATRRLIVDTARPTREAGLLLQLFRLRLDALSDPLDPGFGFDALRLSVLTAAPLAQRQPRLDGDGGHDAGFADLIDRLVARMGRDNVRGFVACDTHDPIRAAMTAPVGAGGADGGWRAPEAGAPPLRPLTLFEPPQPIDDVLAEVPDAPPRRFRWRRVLHEVVAAEGPERIAPEWWRESRAGRASATRDYYRVEDVAGRRFWIFREGVYAGGAPPRWFLHGLFA